jgi:lysyl-tRNA synthetase class I
MDYRELAAYFALIDYSDDTFELDAPVAELHERARIFIGAMNDLLPQLEDGHTSEEYMTICYAVGKEHYGKERLRSFFRDVYLVLTGRPEGSRLGLMIEIFGASEFRERMMFRLYSPFALLSETFKR